MREVLQPYMQLLIGFITAIFISLLSWRAQSLSQSGALAAAVLGTVIFGLGGLAWAIILLTFFISSSVLSHLFKRRKAALLKEKFSKGTQRDAWQVLANGGTAGLFVVLHVIYPQNICLWLGFAGALAAVNADTWATELGMLSRRTPRLIIFGKPVEKGTSGGVTLSGTFAALIGALLIGLFTVFLWQGNSSQIDTGQAIVCVVIITIAGFVGSLVDSLLGATVQAIYICNICKKETECTPTHSCGSPTVLKRGWSWLNNDWVNFFCALTGSVLTIIAWCAIIQSFVLSHNR